MSDPRCMGRACGSCSHAALVRSRETQHAPELIGNAPSRILPTTTASALDIDQLTTRDFIPLPLKFWPAATLSHLCKRSRFPALSPRCCGLLRLQRTAAPSVRARRQLRNRQALLHLQFCAQLGQLLVLFTLCVQLDCSVWLPPCWFEYTACLRSRFSYHKLSIQPQQHRQ